MSYVAVIPARGGSKRIPRKNIRLFLGKPMIAYSIQAALDTGLFDRVIVSTDDEEIADIAQAHGADVPFLRSQELSNDQAGLGEVMSHSVQWMKDNDYNPLAVCCILATAPFIQTQDIHRGLSVLQDGNWQYVFSATSAGFSVYRSFYKNESQGLSMVFPEHYKARSQDLPDVTYDAGQFYWARPQAWLEEKKVFEPWSTVIELPRWRVQDIDTLEDWQRAEVIMKLFLDNGQE